MSASLHPQHLASMSDEALDHKIASTKRMEEYHFESYLLYGEIGTQLTAEKSRRLFGQNEHSSAVSDE